MNKYYVSCGKRWALVMAGNPNHACILAFQRMFGKRHPVLLGGDEEDYAISNTFRVSERGFEEHDDDIIVETDLIIKLQLLSNNFVAGVNVEPSELGISNLRPDDVDEYFSTEENYDNDKDIGDNT